MKTAARIIAKVRAVITYLESPKVRQAWRFARIAGAFVAASGVVDQLANGTATRAGIIAVVVGAVEVAYRAKVKA